MISRRALLGGICVATIWPPLCSEAQQPAKVPRIGVLRSGSPPDPYVDAFRHGLRELGYVEGRNIIIEYRWAEGREEGLAALAAGLARARVDIIVASGVQPAMAAKHATSTIPSSCPSSLTL